MWNIDVSSPPFSLVYSSLWEMSPPSVRRPFVLSFLLPHTSRRSPSAAVNRLLAASARLCRRHITCPLPLRFRGTARAFLEERGGIWSSGKVVRAVWAGGLLVVAPFLLAFAL